MKKHKQISRRELIMSMVTWSLFILVYWISFHELYTLSKYGRFKNNIPILLGCMAFFLVWFIIQINRVVKRHNAVPQESTGGYKLYSQYKTIWTCTVVIIIIVITGFYEAKIYHSAINFNGKLAWFVRDLKNKRTVKLEHNNIYEDGIEGLFTDINKKVNMPEKLYVVDDFSLEFDANGDITSFDTFLYGKNDKGDTESFLITYNSYKSRNIIIYLNGYANPKYNDDKLLEPLFNTMKVIPLKKTVSSWSEERYGILYYGKRSFGYNTTGIVYVDSKGNTNSDISANSELLGYFVSVYVPGRENAITPVRYKFTDSLDNDKIVEPSQEDKKSSNKSNNTAGEFYLSKQVGYRLEITDAALGSRAYALVGTTDGGITWKTINADPFSVALGASANMTFLSEKLGFLCLSSSGGSRGQLYRTEDGGLSCKKIDFPEVKAALSNGETYNPFNLPEMPYEKDGNLNVLVGQGSDGDYNGGSKALYQSKDNGVTWKYINEVPNN